MDLRRIPAFLHIQQNPDCSFCLHVQDEKKTVKKKRKRKKSSSRRASDSSEDESDAESKVFLFLMLHVVVVDSLQFYRNGLWW